jgi:hypothetical protein
MKLIYHRLGFENQTSNFDTALLRVATNAPTLKLVSPYIGLSYLTRLTQLSSDWQLLTDVEAWLKAVNRKHRAQSWNFISENLDRIKHVADLHAKVAIGNNLLFLGSANFTNFGIQNRTELSILIDESPTVEEATRWFQDLWLAATPPIIEEGDILVSTLNKSQWTSSRSTLSLTSTAPKIQSALAENRRPSKGLDIAALVAEAGLNEEKVLFSLTTEYENTIESFLINHKTFTFSEIFSLLKKKQRNISRRNLFALLSKDTVNHITGGLSIEGYDRFIFEDNKFMPWNEHGLSKIRQLNNILHFIIEVLDFSTPKHLPLEGKWLQNGLATHKILPLIDQLINVGLITEVDKAGDIENYCLDHEFEWPRRWIKFSSAHSLFKNRLLESRLKEEINNEADEYFADINTFNSKNNYLERFNITLVIKEQIVKEASKQRLSPKALGIKQDEVLANHLTSLKLKKKLTSNELNELVDDLKKEKLPKAIIKELLNKNGGAFTLNELGKHTPSKSWEYLIFLNYYPKSLTLWQSLSK